MEIYLHQLLRAPSQIEWIRFSEILAGIGVVIGIGEGVRYALQWPPEFTRKLVHVSVALLIFFAPILFVAALPGLILGAMFTLFAYGSVKLGLLRSLHAVPRGANGTVYYPLSFVVLILLFWNSHPEIVSLSMLVLGLGDASAAIVGESIKNPTVFHLTTDKKSMQGSTVMFLTTTLGLLTGLAYFDGVRNSCTVDAIAVISCALIATAWEAISSYALDNLTIPLSVGCVLYYFLVPTPMQNASQFGIGVALGVFIGVVAFYAKFLKANGAVATFLLASLGYGVGGWKWTFPILVFFILSSLLSKLGNSGKKEIESLSEKSGTRDAGQVAANGGVAGILMLAQYVFQNVDLYPIYLGAVSAVTADTWGTEIGTYFKGKTVSIVSMREMVPGTSGGVSLAGFAGSFLGAGVVAASGGAWIGIGSAMVVAIVAGMIGSVADSLLGATVQAQYRCPVCGKNTERKAHCAATTQFVSGIRWINNDAVNWICAIVGAAAVFLLI